MIPCSIVLVGFLGFETFGICLVTTFTKVSILGCPKWEVSHSKCQRPSKKNNNIDTWKWSGTGRAFLNIMISILFVSFTLQDYKKHQNRHSSDLMSDSLQHFIGNELFVGDIHGNEPDISDNQLRTVQKMMWGFSKIKVPQKTIG